MTYREKIQELIKRIDSVYDEAEALRDFATLEEKEYWNEIRRIFYSASVPLRKLDNKLKFERATQQYD